MPRGNWRYFITIGLAALFAAFIGGIIYKDASNLQAFYEHQANKNAQAYGDTAREHAERACAGVIAPKRFECIHEQHHDARQRQREEYDLQAQLVTSVWTRAMGLAALIATSVGILGVVLIYTTFNETRRTNRIAMKEGARATRRAIAAAAATQTAMENQLRPWISFSVVENGKLWISDDTLEMTAVVTFKNIGDSPAIDLTYMGTMVFGADVRTPFDNLIKHFHTGDTDWADKTLFTDETWTRTVVAAHSGKRKGVHEITFVVIARYRTPFSDKYRFTARAFDAGLTKQNSYGEIVPIGHRNIDIGVVQREIVRLIEKQHFSGFTN